MPRRRYGFEDHDAYNNLSCKTTFGLEGRYSLTIEHADNLTADELSMIHQHLEIAVASRQRKAESGDTGEEEIRRHNEATGTAEDDTSNSNLV